MTDHEVEPDPVVRTALRLLPIPGHADDFWTRVERTLDAEPGPVQPEAADPRSVHVAAPAMAASDPVVELDPALALVPPALRRTSNAVLVAVAAAAFVVVAVAGNSLLEERSGTKQVSSDDATEASAALDRLQQESPPRSVAPGTMSADDEETSSAAVLEWVADLGAGDADDAWAAMGAESQAHFGSQDAFEGQLTDLAEGYGAWSAADPDDVLVTPILSSDDGAVAVVTLVGTVAQEGLTRRRAEAFPVRVTGDDVVLEPFALAGVLEIVVPERTATADERPVAPGEELVVVVPSGAEAPVLRLDDGDPVVCGEAEGSELTSLEDTPGQRCSFLPAAGIGSGEHTLTVAFVGSDGSSISAESVLFEAA